MHREPEFALVGVFYSLIVRLRFRTFFAPLVSKASN